MVKNIRAIYTVHITFTDYVYVSIKYPDILNVKKLRCCNLNQSCRILTEMIHKIRD
jgi:hypothetical protein